MTNEATLLGRMRTGTAVIGSTQRLPGYSLLIYDGDVDQLTDLPQERRVEFLADLALLGEAVQRACSKIDPGFRRINYEVLGNTWEHLHGHVHARYRWEADGLRNGPVWRYGDRDDERYRLGPEHEPLKLAIAAELALV